MQNAKAVSANAKPHLHQQRVALASRPLLMKNLAPWMPPFVHLTLIVKVGLASAKQALRSLRRVNVSHSRRRKRSAWRKNQSVRKTLNVRTACASAEPSSRPQMRVLALRYLFMKNHARQTPLVVLSTLIASRILVFVSQVLRRKRVCVLSHHHRLDHLKIQG